MLLIDIENVWALLSVIFGAVVAMLAFSAATQGFWLVKNRIWESIALCLIAFVLFRPGFFWDMAFPKYQNIAASQIESIAGQVPENGTLRLVVEGETIDGKLVKKTVQLPLGASGAGSERLLDAGLEIVMEDNKVLLDFVAFDSAAQRAGLDFDWEILNVEVLSDRLPKQLMFIPALLLLALLALLQKRRVPPAPVASDQTV